MHLSTTLLLAAATLTTATTSAKRGLVFVPSAKYPDDNYIWDNPSSDLTWYYNYGVTPSAAYSNTTQADWEFVPMLWSTSTTFYSDVKSLISGGRNITHVIGYNEPDGTIATGGSSIDPSTAATNWISQMEPLSELGVKLGAPAVTGSEGGFTWLSEFQSACASQGTNCTLDFIPVHWYGNFEGLASHLGQVRATFPNSTIWVTEYAYNNVTLEETQDFYNESSEYFDRIDYIERYSYFGAFRSDVSNVGPNAAMLTSRGLLTSIGSWYLGGAATANIPTATGAGAAVRSEMFGTGVVIAMVVGLLLL